MCYRRAESNDDREGIALTELARLYLEAGDRTQVTNGSQCVDHLYKRFVCYFRDCALVNSVICTKYLDREGIASTELARLCLEVGDRTQVVGLTRYFF